MDEAGPEIGMCVGPNEMRGLVAREMSRAHLTVASNSRDHSAVAGSRQPLRAQFLLDLPELDAVEAAACRGALGLGVKVGAGGLAQPGLSAAKCRRRRKPCIDVKLVVLRDQQCRRGVGHRP